MANFGGRNFTNFSNVNVKGSGTASGYPDPGQFRMVSGTNDAWTSTLSISPISGSTVGSANGSIENPYFHIENAGLSVGTGFIRYRPFGGSTAGTISVNTTYNDTDRAWTLPSKSGTIGITGTFTVNLPAVSAVDILSTNVTVTGIRAEDGIVATIQGMTTTGIGTRGYVFLGGISAGNGGVHCTFVNPTSTATVYKDVVVAYTAVR